MGSMAGYGRRALGSDGPRIGAFNAALAVSLGAAIGLAILDGGAVAAEPVRLLAFGDSLTAGYGLPEADGFVARLEAALAARGHAVEVINGGVSGDTTAGGRDRLEWALGDDPDAVILALGANDGLRGLDPAVTRDNLASMLATLAARDLPVLLVGMLAPPNLGPDYGARFDAVYPALAEEWGVPLYPFFLEGVATDPALNQADGIHPNAAGVEVIVEAMLPAVEALLSGISPGN